MNILKEMEKKISEFKGKSVSINEDTTFEELDFDSLDTADLIMQVEDEYRITFDDDMQVSTMGELVEKIKELMK